MLKRLITRFRKTHHRYDQLRFDSMQIANERFKHCMGGGADKWDRRGCFQLHFLKSMGLEPDSRLLDVGCGPLRAGQYFIAYLNEGRYHGVDYNADFIRAAQHVIRKKSLTHKNPVLEVVEDFAFPWTTSNFDFAIAFSVLNHCSAKRQRLFFR